MVFVKIGIHSLNLDRSKRLFRKRFPKEYKKAEEFLKLLSIGEINKGKAVGERRQFKYLYALSVLFSYIKKPISQLTKKDMQDFIDKLTKDKIKKQNKQPYAETTKIDFKVVLRSYIKWRLPKRYAELTDWFDIRLKKTTPEYLKESETEKLYNACNNNTDRFLVAVLFDGGLRAEEFLNIRFEDIIEPTESFPYYKIEIKEEYSKTDGRTIGLYWKKSTEAIREYLAEVDSSDQKKPVFGKRYGATRMFLKRLGKRVLNKRIFIHLFRKSSATYYAPKLNRQQLCVRYGWKFSSDMPDIYIKRAGVEEEEVKEKFKTEKFRDVEIELGRLKEGNKIKNMQFEELKIESSRNFKLLKDLSSIVQIMLKAAVGDKKTETHFKEQLNKVFPNAKTICSVR